MTIVSSHDIIWHWLREGWKYRGCRLWQPEQRKRYAKRVKYEMGMFAVGAGDA